ncbi:hypothetical protein AMTR_s00126p00081380 [Amborella trichopoda]|uniref:Uncharacterized protein n=1 Tax=Amborella trichopoda TaxID=13333 RepID=W1NNB2_AMBTC|nr:hypothetical protein AMTR_s00126p00081380 [Amborella trichopoda]
MAFESLSVPQEDVMALGEEKFPQQEKCQHGELALDLGADEATLPKGAVELVSTMVINGSTGGKEVATKKYIHSETSLLPSKAPLTSQSGSVFQDDGPFFSKNLRRMNITPCSFPPSTK